MRTLLLACLLLCGLGWSRVYAQDADTLLAQSKQAAGGDAWNDIRSLFVTSEGSQGGVQMVEEQHLDVRTGCYLTTYRLGTLVAPIRTENAEGYDGKIAWEMDPSGYSHQVTDVASLRRVVNKAYLTSHAYWFPNRAPAQRQYIGRKSEGGLDFDVVQVTQRGGQPFDLWINTKTHLIERLVEQESLEKWTTYFSEYGKAGGLRIPFATRSTNGNPASDITRAVRTDRADARDEKFPFGVPQLPTPDYNMPPGKDSVTIPFQFAANKIFVPIRINGRAPSTAVFDTGCSSFLMTPTVAADLGLTPQGASQTMGFGAKSLNAGIVEVGAVQIGEITLLHPSFAVVDIDTGPLAIKTLVGYEVLRRFVVRVDFDTHLLTLTRPAGFIYRGGGIALPLHLLGHIPAVDGSVDGMNGLFTLDTGSGVSLDLFAPFVKAHDLRRRYMAGFTTETGVGIGGTIQGQSVQVEKLTMGAAEVRRVETDLAAEQGGVTSDTDIAGNIGVGVLRQFNLTFDYTHGQVILEKNKGYGQSESGHAGLALEPQDNGWRVTSVSVNGAAALAGIKEGDRVLTIDGKNGSQLPFLALWDVFHRPIGTTVWLLLQDGSQKRVVAVTLGKVP